jgi:hypothetical protein
MRIRDVAYQILSEHIEEEADDQLTNMEIAILIEAALIKEFGEPHKNEQTTEGDKNLPTTRGPTGRLYTSPPREAT